MRAYGLNSSVCYLGVDTNLFQDRGLAREPFVVGLGSITPNKNVRLAIQAIGSISGVKPPLVWIGNTSDAEYVAEMKQLAESLSVDFRPKPMASDEELVDTLNRATAMIYAPRLEPFGLAPLEANACGCPVVAVAEGGVRETIVDGVNGRLAPSNPEALGQAVESLLKYPSAALEMGQEAKRLVADRWSAEGGIDRIERALLEVAGKAR
jgi:glycosyltransferase involved in cell wall biosynthesis